MKRFENIHLNPGPDSGPDLSFCEFSVAHIEGGPILRCAEWVQILDLVFHSALISHESGRDHGPPWSLSPGARVRARAKQKSVCERKRECVREKERYTARESEREKVSERESERDSETKRDMQGEIIFLKTTQGRNRSSEHTPSPSPATRWTCRFRSLKLSNVT